MPTMRSRGTARYWIWACVLMGLCVGWGLACQAGGDPVDAPDDDDDDEVTDDDTTDDDVDDDVVDDDTTDDDTTDDDDDEEMCEVEHYDLDEKCDGEIEQCVDYGFTEDGQPTSTSDDTDCDGTPDVCQANTYDGDGNLILTGSDANCDGTPDTDCTVYADYAKAAGDGAGTVGADSDCNSVPETSCQKITYDEDGNPLTVEFDNDCNGEADACAVYTYEDGVFKSYKEDSKCNDTDDYCYEDVYQPFGDGQYQQRRFDTDCDGEADNCQFWIYNEDGHLLRTGVDANCKKNGTSDCVNQVWTGDGITGSNVDSDCDGKADTDCVTATVNDDGVQLTIENDTDCDGETDVCTKNLLDADGRIDQTVTDEGCDEDPEVCQFYDHLCF
ncbi:MAG: hypothetical protein H6684_16710 [Deltaproteobacteria bacterium]|nr:hypothetical protein [Deltaproteobacteria bacterium]MCB9479207.1 hypothetical protein [Deltaproteobacteria bacterium]MCB9490376.1 hypothetical protein [Deltaproteobacteria bacterium]